MVAARAGFMTRPRLLLIPASSELEWVIRPQLEEWAEVLDFNDGRLGLSGAIGNRSRQRRERADKSPTAGRGSSRTELGGLPSRQSHCSHYTEDHDARHGALRL